MKPTKRLLSRGRLTFAHRSAVIESLESRRLFAVVTFTGAADGISFTTAGNWSPARVPGIGDDVVVPSLSSVSVSSFQAVNSVNVSGTLRVLQGGQLAIRGSLPAGNALTMQNGSQIIIDGSLDPNRDAVLSFEGSGLANGQLIGGTGGTISLQSARAALYNLITGATPAQRSLTIGSNITVNVANGIFFSDDLPNKPFVNNGTINIASASPFQTRTVVNNGTFASLGSTAIFIEQTFVNNGSFRNTSADVVVSGTVTNNNSFIFDGGNLFIGSGNAVGSFVGNIASQGAVIFQNVGVTTYDGVISGSALLFKTGTGSLNLTGQNTYTGDTTIDGGTLTVGVGSTTGSINSNVFVSASGRLAFNRSDDITFARSISGEGAVEHAGTGRLTLSGANSFEGGLTVRSSGTLSVSSESNLGALTGALTLGVTAAPTLEVTGRAFNRTTRTLNIGSLGATFSIADAANDFVVTRNLSNSLTKSGPGTLTLAGANSFPNGLFVNSGTLRVGDGASNGTVTGPIQNNAALVFDLATDSTYAGVVSGSGPLTKRGTGRLNLSNTLSLPSTTDLTIERGSIVVPELINAGGVIISVGASVSVLGAFTNTGSIFLDIGGTSPGQFGLINAGSASLAGSFNAFLSINPPVGTVIFPFFASSITGTFANVSVTPIPGGRSLDLSYTPQGIRLSADAALVRPSTPTLDPGSDSGVSSSDSYTSVVNPTFFGTDTTGSLLRLLIDGVEVASGFAVNGVYVITAPPLAPGVRIVNISNAFQTATAPLTITIDTSAPVVTPPPVSRFTAPTSAGANADFVATAADDLDSSPFITYSRDPGSLFPLGSTGVTATATDRAGNAATIGFTVTVIPKPFVGSPDTTFNNGTGTVVATIPGAILSAIDSVTIATGQVLSAGIDAVVNRLVVTLLNADGSIDATFGTGGFIRVGMPANFTARRIRIDGPTRLIYVTGTATDTQQPAAARFTAEGNLDTSFGSAGVLTISALLPGDRADTVVATKRGFLVAGATVRPGERLAVVTHVGPTGTLTTTFGRKGYFTRPGGPLDTFVSLAVDSRGAIYALGTASTGSAVAGNFASSALLIRLTASGRLDRSLRTNLYSVPGFAVTSGVKVSIQPADRKVVFSVAFASGFDSASVGLYGSGLFRLNARLLPDLTLAGSGLSIIALPPAPGTQGAKQVTSLSTSLLANGMLGEAFDAAIASFTSQPGGRVRNLSTRTSANNTLVTQTQIIADGFDFSLSKLVFNTKAPVKPKARVAAAITVSNVGSINAPANTPVTAFLFAPNRRPIAGDAPIGSAVVRAPIKPGASLVVRFRLLADLAPGNYTLFLSVNNGQNTAINPTNEIDVFNNLTSSTAPLRITATGKNAAQPIFALPSADDSSGTPPSILKRPSRFMFEADSILNPRSAVFA